MADVEIWLGPLLLGSTFNIFLLGFVLVEGRRYYRSVNKDGLPLKLLVAYLLCMEIFTAAAFVALVWHFCIEGFQNFLKLFEKPWAMIAVPLLSACSSLPVQLFYARRVVNLTRRLWFGIMIGVIGFVIVGIAVAITTCLSLTTMPPANNINSLVHILGSVAIALHLVNDVAIAFSLIWHLHKNRTGIPRSDALIDDIVRLTIQTGSLTAIVVIVLLITNSVFMNQTSNSASAILYMPLSKFYSLSLLVTLNARQRWSFGSTNSRMWDTAPVAVRSPDLGGDSNVDSHSTSNHLRRGDSSTVSAESNPYVLHSLPHLQTTTSMHLSTINIPKESTAADIASLEHPDLLSQVDPSLREHSLLPRLKPGHITHMPP